MIKKRKLFIKDYTKIAALAEKLKQLDKQSQKVEKDFFKLFDKLDKTAKLSKKVKQQFYSSYRSILLQRAYKFKKLIRLK